MVKITDAKVQVSRSIGAKITRVACALKKGEKKKLNKKKGRRSSAASGRK